MTDDKQTNETDTKGNEADSTPKEPVSTTPLIDVATAVAERIEKANVETARLLKEQVDLEARKALGGELGGHSELNMISEADKKKKDAAEFFKDTALEKAILNDEKK